jgi:hypothetical protein
VAAVRLYLPYCCASASFRIIPHYSALFRIRFGLVFVAWASARRSCAPALQRRARGGDTTNSPNSAPSAYDDPSYQTKSSPSEEELCQRKAVIAAILPASEEKASQDMPVCDVPPVEADKNVEDGWERVAKPYDH